MADIVLAAILDGCREAGLWNRRVRIANREPRPQSAVHAEERKRFRKRIVVERRLDAKIGRKVARRSGPVLPRAEKV